MTEPAQILASLSFADWLTNRMLDLDLSTRDVERASGVKPNGKPMIAHTTVQRLMSGLRDPSVVSEDIIKGLAKATRTPERQLRLIAGRKAPLGPYLPPRESQYLSRDDRATLDRLIRSLAEKGR